MAERLGAAYIALPALLRAQLHAVQKTGSQLPAEAESVMSLAESLRTGKLISATSTLRAVQTALHAAPEGVILVEHSHVDNPLESLVAAIRPGLVLLVQPHAATPVGAHGGGGATNANAGGAARSWADAVHDSEARQAYALRCLEALGDDAPIVRICPASVDECADAVLEFVCSDDAAVGPDHHHHTPHHVDHHGGGGGSGGGGGGGEERLTEDDGAILVHAALSKRESSPASVLVE